MRFGLFGTGWWATDTQGPGLIDSPDADLVGVWGRSPEKARVLAEKFGCPAYEDADRLIADVDAVAVALPPDVQAPLAVRAAGAGRHLLLDKPLSLSRDDADGVVAAVERAGVASTVFFTGRYQPTTEKELQSVCSRAGWTGGRATVFVSVLRPGGPLLDSGWRVEQGALWDAAPHMISPLVTGLGEIEEVTGLEGAERTTVITARHRGGAVSTMATTLQAPPEAGEWSIEFHGEPGWASLPGWDVPGYEAFASAASELVRLAEGTEPGAPARAAAVVAARHVVSVISAVEESIATRRTVAVR